MTLGGSSATFRRPPRALALGLALSLAAAGAAAGAPIPVGGRVLDGEGGPLAGAEAFLEPPGGAPLGPAAGARDPLAPRAVSARDGRFRLEAPEPGLWRVRVEAPGGAPAVVDLLPLVEPIELPPLRMPAATPVEIRVIDASGAAVPGATLIAERSAALAGASPPTSAGAAPDPPWQPAEQRLRTDEHGRAALTVHPPPGRVLVLAAGFPPQRVALAAEAGRTALLRLAAGRPCSLVALDAEERPVAAASVALEGLGPVGETGDDGRLSFLAPIAGGRVRVLASDGRWAAGELAPAGEPTLLTVRPPVEWRGLAVDRTTGAPLDSAVVWSTLHPARATRSDRTGAFSLSLPFSAGSRLGAGRAGYLPTFLEVELGRPAAISVELRPASRLAGRVVDERGAPVPGADLRVAPAGLAEPPPALERWGRSGPDGAYTIPGLHPHGEMWLRATAPGFAPVRLELALAGGGAAERRMVLRRGRASSGRVLTALDGAPLPGARVIGLPSSFEGDAESLLTAGETAVEAIAGAGGRFELPVLPPGEIDLLVSAAGHVPRRLRALPLPPGESVAELPAIHLQAAAELAGLAVDPAGQPLDGCSVHRLDENPAKLAERIAAAGPESGAAARCAPDGSFRLAGLEPGRPVRFRVERPGYLRAEAEATPGESEEPVRVALRPEVRISGRVEDDAGEPIPSALLMARPANGGRSPARRGRMARADAEGRFELTGLEAGDIEVHALGAGRLGAVETVTARAGEPVEDLRLVLERGASVAGLVVDPGERPVAGAMVRLLDAGRPEALAEIEPSRARSDAEGGFELSGLATGRRLLAVEHPGFQPGRFEVEVSPADNFVTLRLEPGLTLEGVVIDGAGLPAVGTEVSLRPLTGGGGRRARSGTAGEFRFSGLHPGSYQALAERTGLTSSPADGAVELVDRPLSDLVLRLEPGARLSGRVLGLPFDLLEETQVSAQAPGRPGRPGRLDSAGGYAVDGLAPGEWSVGALVPSLGREARGRVRIEPGQTEALLDLELPEGFTLSGVVARDGLPVPGAMVACSSPSGGGGTVSGPDGRFAVTGLTAGSYVVTALEPGRGEVRRVIEVTGDLDLVLPLDPAAGGL